jgi:hypothetical protein
MRIFTKLTVLFLAVLFLGSCAAHHPYAKARPKAGKKKSCNCPDFGFNRGITNGGIYFYINNDINLKVN